MTFYQIDMYLYVRIDVWKKTVTTRKKHPPQGDDASTVLAGPCRVGRVSKVRHVQQSSHREVDVISISGVYGSKPGLNLTSRLLRHGQHVYTYIHSRNIFGVLL